MVKFPGRKLACGAWNLVDRILSWDGFFPLAMVVFFVGGIMGVVWYSKYQWDKEQHDKDVRQKEYEARTLKHMEQQVDEFIREFAEWAALPDILKKDVPMPEAPKYRAAWMLERRMSDARNGVGMPDLKNEPTATRAEYAARLLAYKKKYGWMKDAGPESYAFLAIDRAERQWLTEMENRFNAATLETIAAKIKASGKLEEEILVVEFADVAGRNQVGYYFSGGTHEQYNDAVLEIVNAGPSRRSYKGGIWLPGAKEKGWYSVYSSKYDATSGESPIVDLGDQHVVAVRLSKDKAKVVFNSLSPDFRLVNMEKAVLALAQKAGLDVNDVRHDWNCGAYDHCYKLSKIEK